MADLKPEDVNVRDIVHYKDPVTLQELRFLVTEKLNFEDADGFTCSLQLLDEPKRSIRTLNKVALCTFFAEMQIRQVADDAYAFRAEHGEWPSSDVILLSKCYKKVSTASTSTEDLKALDGYLYSREVKDFDALVEPTEPVDSVFLAASKARELAEHVLAVKERLALRIEEAAKSGVFETYLTDEEFRICLEDLVEQGYEVFSDRVSWDPEV